MKHSRKNTGVHHNKTFKGGKTFASMHPVKLHYDGTEVLCDVCGTNSYHEYTSSIGKSKVRSLVGQLFLGIVAGTLDTTSVLLYSCANCGMCRVVRNLGSRKIAAK